MIENLQLALCPAGFTVKGFVRSGSDPPEELSKDGVSVKVGGAKWYLKVDKIIRHSFSPREPLGSPNLHGNSVF